jgi:hypothetical protein
MSDKLSLALVLNGSIANVIAIRPQLENLIASKGLRLIFIKSASRRLFIIEDDYPNGDGQG